MTLSEQTKLTKNICRLLKVQEITFPIGRTNKGNLGITFNANNEDFEIMLDSVPLPTKSILEDENNIELKRILTAVLFEPERVILFSQVEEPRLSINGEDLLLNIDASHGVQTAETAKKAPTLKKHGNAKAKKTG